MQLYISPSYACTQPWVSTTGNEATVTLVRAAARVQGLTDFHNCRVTLFCFLLLSRKSAIQLKAAAWAVWGVLINIEELLFALQTRAMASAAHCGCKNPPNQQVTNPTTLMIKIATNTPMKKTMSTVNKKRNWNCTLDTMQSKSLMKISMKGYTRDKVLHRSDKKMLDWIGWPLWSP